MTILEIIFLVLPIPLASLYLSTILINSSAFLIILFSSLLLYNMLGLIPLYYEIEILEGFLQTSLLIQIPSILGGSSFIEESSILLSFMPIVYSNAETEKSSILTNNKGKAGIYLWEHNDSGKIYIGSAFDLYKRLRNYYSYSYLNRYKRMYIYNALLSHGYSAFSLTILEYIDISNLSKADARKLIIEREQYYLDKFNKEKVPMYNLLKFAGSSLGYTHNLEDIAKMKANIREALSDPVIRAKMSAAQKGAQNHLFGKPRDAETKAKISITKGTPIFQFDAKGILVNTFSSAREAGKFFNSSKTTIKKYATNGELFQGKWTLFVCKSLSDCNRNQKE
jgi:group I intron endonuclease